MKIMNTKILLTLIAVGFLISCNKNKYTTRPQLKYKSVNTRVLSRNQQLTFTLEATDAEGDLQDSIWVQEVVKNCSSGGGTTKYKMPDFAATKDLKGDIVICYAYGINLGCPDIIEPRCSGRNDSATYKFWIKDNANHVSDTVTSDQVVVLQQ